MPTILTIALKAVTAVELALDGFTYDSVSLDVSGQDAGPAGLFFQPDGSKLFITGGSDSVLQYSLSTPWDLNTASYDSVSLDVSSQNEQPHAISFRSDGTRMYMTGRLNGNMYQYTLSTPWDLSTASYDSVSFSVSSQESTPLGAFFKSDGTKMFVVGSTADNVFQYTLSTPWDLSTASYDSVSFNVNAQQSSPNGLFFSSDGTKMFVSGQQFTSLHQYTLSTPWDVGDVSFDDTLNVGDDGVTFPQDLFFSSDNTKMYVICSNTDAVHQYSK